MTELYLIELYNTSILQQLQLEEALLRTDKRNFCIINHGSPPAIVMGISGKPEKLLNLKKIHSEPLPIIKRYSGGGTVVVDESTLFISFIFNKSSFFFEAFPQNIMKWSQELYQPLFGQNFSLKENDYVFGEKKFGGNAQYIQKDRWVHHSTLLWDFDPHNMDYLILPEKRPSYRKDRDHRDFLCTLKPYFPYIDQIVEGVKLRLSNLFILKFFSSKDYIPLEHRRSTEIINKFNLNLSL